MHEKTKKAILCIYKILLCLSIAVAGVCLIAQCLLIYNSGEQPYSTESVANAFSEIALPLYFCGAMVLLGVFLKPFLAVPVKKAEKNYPFILRRLQQSTDLSLCPQQLQEDMHRLRRRQRLIQILNLSLLAAGAVFFLSYGTNPAHFHKTDINTSMITAMYYLIPSMVIPFAFGVFSAYYGKKATLKEIELLKQAPAEAKTAVVKTDEPQHTATWLRIGILAVAVFMICFGYLIGGATDVLTKAVNICTECIGLG